MDRRREDNQPVERLVFSAADTARLHEILSAGKQHERERRPGTDPDGVPRPRRSIRRWLAWLTVGVLIAAIGLAVAVWLRADWRQAILDGISRLLSLIAVP